MGGAKLAAIATHLPESVLSNDDLALLYPDWPAEKILEKTGIEFRRIAAPNETAGDLAEAAARKLFAAYNIDPSAIDFLLLCTEMPDHVLPSTACILQHKLGLRREIGALDFNLGCSGFVYGLSLAKALIESGQARRVLLLTADTYSKLIHPMDKSARTLFGDGAAAALIERDDNGAASLGPFVFGTDGAGAGSIMVPAGGYRRPRDEASAREQIDGSGNTRTDDHLLMNGPAVMSFSLKTVPAAIDQLLAQMDATLDDFDLFVFHQANAFMLERLRQKLDIPKERFLLHMSHCGNTVSSSIPIALERVFHESAGLRVMLVGFGAGFSWAAAAVQL